MTGAWRFGGSRGQQPSAEQIGGEAKADDNHGCCACDNKLYFYARVVVLVDGLLQGSRRGVR